MSRNRLFMLVLVALVVVMTVFPLMMNTDSEFGGADGAAEDLIAEIDPSYEAWVAPLMEPPGGETESLLFCLQAALGAGVIGYGFGVLQTRKRDANQKDDPQV